MRRNRSASAVTMTLKLFGQRIAVWTEHWDAAALLIMQSSESQWCGQLVVSVRDMMKND